MTGKVELLTPLGGKVILDPTNTAVDRTLTLPAVAGTVVNNETLRTELNATGSAPIFACRAWCNFNGTGTVAIRASGNVSSITDNGTGDYRVNFTTAMPDANYTLVLSGTFGSANGFAGLAPTTTAARVNTFNTSTGANSDSAHVCVAIFR